MSRSNAMMKVVFMTLILLTFQLFNVQATVVTTNDATLVAKNLVMELALRQQNPEAGEPELYMAIGESANPLIYVFNIGQDGFVLISAEDEVYPVLGWSMSGAFVQEDMPPALTEWLQSYKDQISFIRQQGLKGDESVREAWSRYLMAEEFFTVDEIESTDVGPLLTTQWNQNAYYNAHCPEDVYGPAGRALAGCVATAMGQVMYYYRYPQTGLSYSSYYSSYGLLSANYGATTYRWNEMGNIATPKSHDAISELLYHLGISVEMNYGANASGAYSSNAADALKSYFRYDQSLNLEYKNSYSNTAWANLLINNLDSGHPMYYHGFGSGGHAFNVDGYQGTNHFHFNWGWGGAYDGYFYLNSLNPGSNSFTSGQGAIVNFKPPATNYPYNCTGSQTIVGMAGTIEDGSGPIEEYQDGSNCSWLIQPSGLVDRIEISFIRFSTELSSDVLYIYDGTDANAPLLATISGDTIFPSVVTTGGSAYLRFETDSSNTADGWLLYYEAFRPVFCGNLQAYTAHTATFDDGSTYSYDYNNNTNCKYFINPSGHNLISLAFNYFELEDGKDFLKVYDPTTTPSTLLASYTGNAIPPDVFASNGQMLLIFTSDNDKSGKGWEVTYSSAIGISEPVKAAFEFYPNPAADFVTVINSGSDAVKSIRIYDMTGKEMISIQPVDFHNRSSVRLDLKSLASGLYMVRIEGEQSEYREKLIVRGK